MFIRVSVPSAQYKMQKHILHVNVDPREIKIPNSAGERFSLKPFQQFTARAKWNLSIGIRTKKHNFV